MLDQPKKESPTSVTWCALHVLDCARVTRLRASAASPSRELAEHSVLGAGYYRELRRYLASCPWNRLLVLLWSLCSVLSERYWR